MQGVIFDVPEPFKVDKQIGNKVYILTDDKPFTVHLVMEIQQKDLKFYEENGSDPGDVDSKDLLPNGGVFFNVLGASGIWDGVLLDNNHVYSLTWDITSTEPRPSGADGAWEPESKYGRDAIEEIERTARLAK